MAMMVFRNGAYDKGASDAINNERAVIGGNQPPTPFDALKAHIDDLDLEARNHLDGDPITTEAEAEAVSRILDDARKASKAADDARKDEARPFDDGKAAVQAKWKPLIGQADLAATTAKKALAPWLQRLEDEQRAAAEAALEEARQKADAAAQAAARCDPSDLAGQTTVRVKQENAAAALKAAQRLDKARAQATGGERAVSLRSRFTAVLDDPVAALKHYRTRQPDELKEWLTGQAQRDVNAGARAIPGFTIKEEKVAQ